VDASNEQTQTLDETESDRHVEKQVEENETPIVDEITKEQEQVEGVVGDKSDY
jgi:hypothetical protein